MLLLLLDMVNGDEDAKGGGGSNTGDIAINSKE